jgi:hypothetical protein
MSDATHPDGPPDEDAMPDQRADDAHPPRVAYLSRSASELRDTFLAAGIDPAISESREKFGIEHRWLRELWHRSEGRHTLMVRSLATIAVSLGTAAALTLGPILLHLLVAVRP